MISLRTVGFVSILFVLHAQAADLTLRGTVVDREGTAIAGASVYVNQERQPQRVETDAQGRFRVDDLAVGRIEAVAVKEGYAIGGIEATMVGPAEVEIILYEPEATRLRITNKRGGVVEGARIKTMFLSDRYHVSVEDLVDLGFPSYRSGRDGYLTIPDLPKGSYLSLVVEHRDFADFHLVTFPVGRELSLPMNPGRTVRGRILSAEGAGVARARVSLFRYGSTGKREFAEVLTDPEGFFVATVEPGDYYIAVKHAAHASPPAVPVRVLPDGEDPSGEITMLPPRYLEGHVEYEGGKPAPAIPVAFVVEQVIVAESWTQSDGSFELLIPPVEGVVRVEPPAGFYTDQIVTAYLEDAVRGEANPITLKPLPRLRGVVRDSDGAPLPNALVTSLNLPETTRVLTDASGAFDIAMNRIPFREQLRFRVEHPLRARRAEFEFDIAQREAVDVKLESYTLTVEKPDSRRKDAEEPVAPEWVNNLDHMVDKLAPEWTCDTWFNSEGVSLASLRGKVVVLVLWGGFPADNGVPEQVSEVAILHRMLRGVEDVAFVGIHDNGKEPDEIRPMLEAAGIEFPVGRDNQESLTLDAYNVIFIPQVVVIDQEGRLRYYRVDDQLLDMIKHLRRSR